MCDVGGAAGGEGAAGCNEKNENPTIECGEKSPKNTFKTAFSASQPKAKPPSHQVSNLSAGLPGLGTGAGGAGAGLGLSHGY